MKRFIVLLVVSLLAILGLNTHSLAQTFEESPPSASSSPESLSQNPWIKQYAYMINIPTALTRTEMGTYVIAGKNEYLEYPVVLELDASGNLLWQRQYVVPEWAEIVSVQDAGDGGIVMAGNKAGIPWVLKLTVERTVAWEKTFATAEGIEYLTTALVTSSGNIVLAVDFFDKTTLLYLEADGTLLWQKTYGLSDNVNALKETSAGDLILTGFNTPFLNSMNTWVLKVASTGELIWWRFYDSDLNEAALDLVETEDGGYVVLGNLMYNQTDEDPEVFILRLAANGELLWQKALEGGDLQARKIRATGSGELIILGTSFSGISSDMILFKIDENGNILWQKVYGGLMNEMGVDIQQTLENGWLVVGSSWSFTLDHSNAVLAMHLTTDGLVNEGLPCNLIGETANLTASGHTALNATLSIGVENASLTEGVSETIEEPVNATPFTFCPRFEIEPVTVEKILTTPGLPDVIYVTLATSSQKLPSQYTLNHGLNWHTPPSSPGTTNLVVGLAPRENSPETPVRLFDWLSGGLYRSGDWGKRWSSFGSSTLLSFAISPHEPQKMFYTNFNWVGTGGGCFPFPCEELRGYIYESEDGGVNWSLYSESAWVMPDRLSLSPHSVTDGYYKINPYGGENSIWSRLEGGEPLTFPVDQIAFDAQTVDRIYGVTDDFSAGSTSTNGGQTWFSWASTPPAGCVQFMAHPLQANTLYLRCVAGLFRSTNGGEAWTQITTIPGDAFAPHLGRPSQILWSHDGCLFASSDAGDTWENLGCFQESSFLVYLPAINR